jgi:seryl-tRNA synthetase
MNTIDYLDLGKAQKMYSDQGYTYIETPWWWVTEQILDITKPEECDSYKLSVNDKCLVASGEQSFLYMINKGQISPGKYQTVTPCYRNEAFDAFHSKYFMKLELIHYLGNHYTTPVYDKMVNQLAMDANYIMRQLGVEVRMVETNQYDTDPTNIQDVKTIDNVVYIKGREVELGSYGARQCDFATWIYGTGLALPRFGKIRERMKSLKIEPTTNGICDDPTIPVDMW